jgi:hypothetical protein
MPTQEVAMKTLLSLLLLALLLPAADLAMADNRPIVDRPTWHVGDTWTYTLTGGGTNTYTVTAVTDTGYVVTHQQTGRRPETLTFTKDLTTDSFWYTVPGTWPLQIPGSQWTVYRLASDRTPVRLTDKTVGWDTVQVPAGTFQAVHIHGQECRLASGSCGDFDWWYAPDVRWYVKQSWADSAYWRRPWRGGSAVLLLYHLSPE